jgi:hypothetical protein
LMRVSLLAIASRSARGLKRVPGWRYGAARKAPGMAVRRKTGGKSSFSPKHPRYPKSHRGSWASPHDGFLAENIVIAG